MKHSFIAILVLLAIGFTTNSCQRDDICPESTPTTPKLIITFYDINVTPTELKDVPSLSITAVGVNNPVSLNESGEIVANTDSIAIPLNPASTVVDFLFVRNSGNDEQNIDELQFSYTPQDDYINRACGFKSNYLDLNFSLNGEDTDSWIQNIEIIESNITDELTTHVTIFH